jgi:ribosomal RNA-processing protein 9
MFLFSDHVIFGGLQVTCGARDRTARLWKIPEESQLVYTAQQPSLDCITLIDESHFVTGAENGFVSFFFLATFFI